jgi:acetolactate synthase I/III small subunit
MNPDNRQTIVALVENKPGVLNRVASLFRRRNFNVDSLTVGRTHKPHVSRMTIVVNTERTDVRILVENLRKLVNVIDVKYISHEPHISRDLALVKVRTENAEAYNTVTQICERYPARIADMGSRVAIVEITASEVVVEEVIDKLRLVGIVEMVRTGIVAMGRGTRIQDTQYTPTVGVVKDDRSNNGVVL